VGVVQNGQAFDLTNLCNHSTVFPLIESGNGPANNIYQYGHHFNAGAYTLIIMGESTGGFGGEIWNGNHNGQLTVNVVANKTWMAMSGVSGSCCQSSYSSLYDTQVVTVNTSGYYNVYLTFAQNVGLNYGYEVPTSPSFSGLQGDLSLVDLSTQTCASVIYVGSGSGQQLNVQTFQMWLTGNQTYTFVIQGGEFSGCETYYGPYTLVVTPGRQYQFTNTTLFTHPDSGTCRPGCTCQACGTPQAYGVTTFTVPANSNFWVWGNEGNFDLEFYIYSESNLLGLTCGTGGLTCFDAENDLYGYTYYSGAATTFTVYVTNWADGTYGSEAFFGLYLLSGPPLVGFSGTSAPSSHAPTSTIAPTSQAPSVAGSTLKPTTRAPSVAGATNKPTTAAPSLAPTTQAPGSGVTQAPATQAPGTTTTKAPSTAQVAGADLHQPCLLTVFCLVGLFLA